jgi:hypothetical protein
MTAELAGLIAAVLVGIYNFRMVFPLHTGRPRGPLV